MDIRFEEKTLVYLQSMTEHLLKEGSTAANPAAPPQGIAFEVSTGDGRKFSFRLQDFAGRFVEPMHAETTDGMAEEARSHLKSCNAILALADSTSIDHRVLNAIDLLPEPTCVIFVPTKIDELIDDTTTLLNASLSEAETIYKRLLSSPQIGEIDTVFRTRYPRNKYRFVAISAFGPVFRNGDVQVRLPLQREDFRPWNVYEPIRLVVEARQRQINADVRELKRQIQDLEDEIERMDLDEKSRLDVRLREEDRQAAELSKKGTEFGNRLDVLRGEVECASISDHLFRSSVLVSKLEQLADEASANGLRGIETGARSLVADIRKHRRGLVTFAFVMMLAGILFVVLYFLFGY